MENKVKKNKKEKRKEKGIQKRKNEIHMEPKKKYEKGGGKEKKIINKSKWKS